MKKNIIHGFLLFFGTLALLFGLQCLINCIPRSLVEDNIRQSIEEVKQSKSDWNRYRPIDKLYMFTDDRLGDFAWLQLIYNVDSKHPIKSTLEMNRYTEYGTYHKELEEQMNNNLSPNDSYGRYWHGMTMILRVLLIWFSLNEIKVIFGIIAGSLWCVAIAFVKNLPTKIMFVLSLIMSGGLFAVISVEYMPVFLLLPGMIIAIMKGKKEHRWKVFLLFGLLTAYFDFLTAETLLVTIPLLLLMSKEELSWKEMFGYAVLWGTGYVGAFLVKFGLCAVFCEKAVIGSFLMKKFAGTKPKSYHYLGQSSVLKNIRDLLPIRKVNPMGLVIGVIVFVMGYVLYLFTMKEDNTNWEYISKLAAIGSIPLVRFAVLNNHSYNHSEFTYRALFATIFSLFLIGYEVRRKVPNCCNK